MSVEDIGTGLDDSREALKEVITATDERWCEVVNNSQQCSAERAATMRKNLELIANRAARLGQDIMVLVHAPHDAMLTNLADASCSAASAGRAEQEYRRQIGVHAGEAIACRWGVRS